MLGLRQRQTVRHASRQTETDQARPDRERKRQDTQAGRLADWGKIGGAGWPEMAGGGWEMTGRW